MEESKKSMSKITSQEFQCTQAHFGLFYLLAPYPLKLIKNNFATLYIPNIVKAFKLFDQKGFKDNEKHHFPHFC